MQLETGEIWLNDTVPFGLVRLVIPTGATALDVGTPIDTLTLQSAAEKTLEIAPGRTSPPIALTQTGRYRAVKGKLSFRP